jgi:hypothetical protein
MSELDPRWDWVEERVLCRAEPTYVRGRCNHLEVIPVESVLDEDDVVAHLCLTCDQQLPAEWRPPAWSVPPTTTELHAGTTRWAEGGVVR